jgi:peptide-methionine (S)-S-oxide reductase
VLAARGDEILDVSMGVLPVSLARNTNGVERRLAGTWLLDEQKRVAEAYIRNDAHVFRDPIVTTLEPLTAFYVAEDYHQDYAARNPNQPYIVYIAQPKVDKLRENFADRLKD